MGKYSEYDRASLSAGWRIGAWVIGILVFCGLIFGGTLIVKAAFSEQKGQLDKQIQINDGRNQIASQENFEDLHAAILAHDKNLDVAAAAVKDDPSAFNKTNYNGLVAMCNEAVAKYNAEARKISRGKWMSPDLPYEINTNDPAYDCKETAR